MKRITAAPGTIGPVVPYSQAVISGHLVFTAGQIPASKDFDSQPDTFEEQVRQTLSNLEAILIAAGSDFDHVIKVNGYLTDPAQLEPFTACTQRYWDMPPCANNGVCIAVGRDAGARLRGRAD